MSIRANPQRKALGLGPVFKMHRDKFSFMPMLTKGPGKHFNALGLQRI
jgi:hypothetical protein